MSKIRTSIQRDAPAAEHLIRAAATSEVNVHDLPHFANCEGAKGKMASANGEQSGAVVGLRHLSDDRSFRDPGVRAFLQGHEDASDPFAPRAPRH